MEKVSTQTITTVLSVEKNRVVRSVPQPIIFHKVSDLKSTKYSINGNNVIVSLVQQENTNDSSKKYNNHEIPMLLIDYELLLLDNDKHDLQIKLLNTLQTSNSEFQVLDAITLDAITLDAADEEIDENTIFVIGSVVCSSEDEITNAEVIDENDKIITVKIDDQIKKCIKIKGQEEPQKKSYSTYDNLEIDDHIVLNVDISKCYFFRNTDSKVLVQHNIKKTLITHDIDDFLVSCFDCFQLMSRCHEKEIKLFIAKEILDKKCSSYTIMYLFAIAYVTFYKPTLLKNADDVLDEIKLQYESNSNGYARNCLRLNDSFYFDFDLTKSVTLSAVIDNLNLKPCFGMIWKEDNSIPPFFNSDNDHVMYKNEKLIEYIQGLIDESDDSEESDFIAHDERSYLSISSTTTGTSEDLTKKLDETQLQTLLHDCHCFSYIQLKYKGTTIYIRPCFSKKLFAELLQDIEIPNEIKSYFYII